jgi:hypothetical protein
MGAAANSWGGGDSDGDGDTTGISSSSSRRRRRRRRSSRVRGAEPGADASSSDALVPPPSTAKRDKESYTPNAKNKRGDNAERDQWATAMRETNSGGRVTKRAWTEHMNKLTDPPALLADVTVILVGKGFVALTLDLTGCHRLNPCVAATWLVIT